MFFHGSLIDDIADRLQHFEDHIVSRITYYLENLMTITITIDTIKTDLANLAAAVAAEGAQLPAGYVAVAQADLDAIDTQLQGLLTALAADAAPPAPTTPPVTVPPVTPAAPVPVASPAANLLGI